MVVSSIISINKNNCELFLNDNTLADTIICTDAGEIEVLDDLQYRNVCQRGPSDAKGNKISLSVKDDIVHDMEKIKAYISHNDDEVTFVSDDQLTIVSCFMDCAANGENMSINIVKNNNSDDDTVKNKKISSKGVSQEQLADIMNTISALASKVERLENEKKAASKKNYKRKMFLSFRRKKHIDSNLNDKKCASESNRVKPVEEKKPVIIKHSEVLDTLVMNPTEEEYCFAYAPSIDDPHSVIDTSDKYQVTTSLSLENTETLSPSLSTTSKNEIVLEKVDSLDDSVLQSWVANVVSTTANELEKDNSPSGQKHSKQIAQRMIFSELENNKNALFTKTQYAEIASSTANLIVTALMSRISKEKVTLLAISHAIWGVLASKDCYNLARKNEVVRSLGSLFADADISDDGSSFTLPTLSSSFESTLIDSNDTTVKYNSFTDFFDACCGRVDHLAGDFTTLSDEMDTLEDSSTLVTELSTATTDNDGYSIMENREITEEQFREISDVRDPTDEVEVDGSPKKISKILSFKKFRPFSKKMNVIDI